uniref:Uncharacterized protein n=1 Tax=Rousettus aegyptiacus TaxID=9407 RepID=A0A7J8FKU8_ROUAE|nr:hypothetical protein HJG63_012136 [Rousettus aegyptiacus]
MQLNNLSQREALCNYPWSIFINIPRTFEKKYIFCSLKCKRYPHRPNSTRSRRARELGNVAYRSYRSWVIEQGRENWKMNLTAMQTKNGQDKEQKEVKYHSKLHHPEVFSGEIGSNSTGSY